MREALVKAASSDWDASDDPDKIKEGLLNVKGL